MKEPKKKLSPRKIVETYVKGIWDRKDLSVIDLYLDEKIKIHSLLGDFEGPAYMKKVVEAWLKGFPNLKVKVITYICEDNYVVIHWHVTANHLGEFKGVPPSGAKVDCNGVSIFKTANNKICEYWTYLDMSHVLRQIS